LEENIIGDSTTELTKEVFFLGSVENLEKVALAVTFVPLSYLILSGGAYQLVLRIAVLRLLSSLGGDFFYRALFLEKLKNNSPLTIINKM